MRPYFWHLGLSMVQGVVLFLFLAGLSAGAWAAGFDYDSRLVYDLCAADQVVSHQSGSAERARSSLGIFCNPVFPVFTDSTIVLLDGFHEGETESLGNLADAGGVPRKP